MGRMAAASAGRNTGETDGTNWYRGEILVAEGKGKG